MNIDFKFLIKIIIDVLISLIKIFSLLLIPAGIVVLLFLFSLTIYYIYFRVYKKIKPIKSLSEKCKEDNFFKKIFILFPKQLALDLLRQDPNDFGEFGIHLFCGSQGSGKTISMVYFLNKWQKKYPKLKVFTNFAYQYENGILEHWKDLIININDKNGVANAIDEIHTWFNNTESKDIDPAFLGEISQQRKQKKAILGSSQIFSKCAKPLREQATKVYLPKTFFNILTIGFITDIKYYNKEKEKFTRYTGFYFFIQTDELRAMYDTYKKIERYKNLEYVNNQNFNATRDD